VLQKLFPNQLWFLTARTIELKTSGNGLIVDPLFDVAVIKDLACDPPGGADLFAHLFGCHAALEFIERRNLLAKSQTTNPKSQQSEQTYPGEERGS
jgi:hypothetical protein